MTTALRTIKKMPHDKFILPDLTGVLQGTGMTWGGTEPVEPEFERFYNPHIHSILTLPKLWYTYESQYTDTAVSNKFVISGIENADKHGVYNTGVNFTIFDVSTQEKSAISSSTSKIGELLRNNLIKQIQIPMGGSLDWRKLGEHLDICSIRYARIVPKMIAENANKQGETREVEMESEEMVFIQDIVCEKQRGIVFSMLFETPRPLFDDKSSNIEDTFRVIKTSSYFCFRTENEMLNDNNGNTVSREEGEDGFLFIQL